MKKKNPARTEMLHSEHPRHRASCGKSYKLRPYFCVLVTLLLFLIPTATVYCEEIPWSNKSFFHVSESESVESFLKNLFLSEGILTSISTSIAGTPVSGKFNKQAEEVFKQITSVFNLIWYFDGEVVYIYPANEIESKIIAVKYSNVENVERSLVEMGIADRKYPLRYHPKENLIMVKGPKAYVKRISEALEAIDVDRSGEQYAGTTQNARIVKRISEALETIDVDQSGEQYAGTVQNVRIFRLKHAWAADQQLQIDDRTITVEGVATILKKLANKKDDQRFSSRSEIVYSHHGARAIKAKETLAHSSKPREKKPLPEVDNLPESRNFIQCAERLNAVIINANPVDMAYYAEVIAGLDVPLQLIEIKASVIDVDSEALSSIGVDFDGSHREGNNTSTYNTNVISGSNPLFGVPQIPTGNFGGLTFSAILGNLADDYLTIRLKALESKGKAKVVSKPSIITFDNIEARFTNTETFYVRVAAEHDASLYEISAGIVLKVTPHIIFEGNNPKIQLMIAIEDGKIKGDVVDTIPVVENSTINTQAVVSENESLLIGGMISETHKEVQRQVPLLGDIPVLGYLFRSKDKVDNRTERLFLISPRVLSAGGNTNVAAQDNKPNQDLTSSQDRISHHNWPTITLFETTF